MNATKHTPAPWQSSPQTDGSFNVFYTRPDGHGWFRVATVTHPKSYLGSAARLHAPADQVGPNVALITAAPDLLEAAERLERAMDDENCEPGRVYAIRVELRAAIAKARGE